MPKFWAGGRGSAARRHCGCAGACAGQRSPGRCISGAVIAPLGIFIFCFVTFWGIDACGELCKPIKTPIIYYLKKKKNNHVSLPQLCHSLPRASSAKDVILPRNLSSAPKGLKAQRKGFVGGWRPWRCESPMTLSLSHRTPSSRGTTGASPLPWLPRASPRSIVGTF